MMVLLCACGGGSAVAPALPQPEPFRPEVRPALTVDELVAGLSVRDRIAQLVIQRFETAQFVEVAELPDSVRGEGGYGSTGGFAATST